jgi:hypothetical protein
MESYRNGKTIIPHRMTAKLYYTEESHFVLAGFTLTFLTTPGFARLRPASPGFAYIHRRFFWLQ